MTQYKGANSIILYQFKRIGSLREYIRYNLNLSQKVIFDY